MLPWFSDYYLYIIHVKPFFPVPTRIIDRPFRRTMFIVRPTSVLLAVALGQHPHAVGPCSDLRCPVVQIVTSMAVPRTLPKEFSAGGMHAAAARVFATLDDVHAPTIMQLHEEKVHKIWEASL